MRKKRVVLPDEQRAAIMVKMAKRLSGGQTIEVASKAEGIRPGLYYAWVKRYGTPLVGHQAPAPIGRASVATEDFIIRITINNGALLKFSGADKVAVVVFIFDLSHDHH